jgi:ribonuclease PH
MVEPREAGLFSLDDDGLGWLSAESSMLPLLEQRVRWRVAGWRG